MLRYLLHRIRRHFLNHGQHQLAVTVVKTYGVAPNLAEEAEFIIRQLGKPLATIAVPGFREELRKRQLHRACDLGQCVERRDGMPVLHPRQIAAQQAGALFNVSLGHPSMQPEVPDGFADIHRKNFQVRLPWMARIVTRVVPSGKWKFNPHLVEKVRACKSIVLSTRQKLLELKIEVRSFFQCALQKLNSAFPSVGGVIWAIPVFIVGILEGVSGIGINN